MVIYHDALYERALREDGGSYDFSENFKYADKEWLHQADLTD